MLKLLISMYIYRHQDYFSKLPLFGQLQKLFYGINVTGL